MSTLVHGTTLETVTNRCAVISCSDIVIDESGVVVQDSSAHWWKDVLLLMNGHGPVVKDRLRQALYRKEG